MHIQSLESRSLMAVIGLDTSFGTNGRVTLSSGAFETTLPVQGAVFVEGNTSAGHAIYKYDDSGKLVTGFGSNGRVLLPVDIDNLTFDSRTGNLYASGAVYSNNYNRQSAYVLRITSAGKLDTSFGEKGLAIYTPRRNSADTTTTVSIAKILPQTDGSVIAALRESVTDTTELYNTDGVDRVRLLKLTASGAPDSGFGSGGAATVYTGRITQRDSEFGSSTADNDDYQIKDIQQRDDGGFRVIASETYSSTFSSAHAFAFGVASRVVTAAGLVNKSLDHAWQIISTQKSAQLNQFRALYVGAESETGVTVVGDGYGLKARVYYLAGDGSQKTFAFSTNGTFVNEVIADNKSGFYAVGNTFVVKLKRDFTIDRTWGDQGQGSFTENGGPSGGLVEDYVADTNGRILRSYGNQVSRLNGTPAARNTRLGTAGVYNGLLDILGTSGNDRITINTDTQKRVFTVTINGVATDIDSRYVQRIALDSGGGDDDIFVTNTLIATGIFTGSGNDRVISGGETNGKLAVNLGIGDDRMVLSAGEVPAYIDGGIGYDTVQGKPLDGLDLRNLERMVVKA